MKKSIYTGGLALLAAVLLPASCQREEFLTPSPAFGGNVHGEEVTVGLSLDVDKEEAGTPEAREYAGGVGTKAVDDPDGTTGITATVIRDFYLLQFNGTADTCRMIGCQYFEDYAKFITDENPNGAGKVKLISSTEDDAVFILANTCDSRMVFLNGMLMSDFKSRVKSIGSQADLFGKGEATGSGTAFPDDRTYHIMLNAQVNATISPGITLNVGLKRNVARVRVIINNTTATTDPDNEVRIDSLALYNVPNVSSYITNTVAPQPEYIPSGERIQTFDYPKEIYNSIGGNVFYVPVNKRGTKDNMTQNTKGVVAPYASTYLRVDARYKSGSGWIPIVYTFYLGANLINDYNLLPNTAYTYTVTMAKKGDGEYDYRVEDWGPVDFTKPEMERANCYILNPAPTYNRQFKIPIDRIRTFWGGEGMTATAGYEIYDESKTADQFMNQNFKAFILWTDIEDINGGDGIYNTADDKVKVDMTVPGGNGACFTVTVKPGTEGNAVVAVHLGTDGSEEVLWSWHLWITDYRPDELHRYSPEDGRYIYEVTGGAVHRYAGTIWETGIYKDKFIMDRNLGALDTTFVNPSTEGKGVLYYQFGRKDPLPGPRTAALYYPKYDLETSLKWKVVGKSDAGAAFTDTTAVRYSVRYPLSFIKAGAAGWTYYNKYNPTTFNGNIRWQDPNVQTDDGKSLFDPCPPGYKAPKSGTWSDFKAYATTRPKPTTNINGRSNPPRNFPAFGSRYDPKIRGGKNQIGAHYYPGTDDVEKTIYYPAYATLIESSGAFNSSYIGGLGSYCSCSPANTSKSSQFGFDTGNANTSYSYSRAMGSSVRCIQE